MTDNKDYTEVFDSPASPLAREHAKRAVRRVKRRKKGVSKATRYTVSILAVILVFFLAFSVGSWIIKLFSAPPVTEETPAEDTVTVLQKRLDELTSKNQALSEEIEELKIILDKYNELYGPLDNPTDTSVSEPFTPDTNPSDDANTTPPIQTPAPVVPEVSESTTPESEETEAPSESLVEEL